jgi:hypothetical protein
MHNIFTIVPNFLREPRLFYESISRNEGVGGKAQALAISSVVFLAIYGFVTGLTHSVYQALSTAVKMPILFVATMFFCLPAFYFFSLILGTKLRLMQVTTVVLAAISVTAFLLLGLSPITLFFVLTSDSYPFFKLLAAVFVGLTGLVGMYFLWQGMMFLDTRTGDGAMNLRRPLLGLWFTLYAFIGSHMIWRLSPFVGDPKTKFFLVRPSRDNFYVDVIKALIELTGLNFQSESFSPVLVGAACLIPLIVTLCNYSGYR